MKIGFHNQSTKGNSLQIPADFRHCLILGETGSGKTASVITPLFEERMKKGHGILIFDFKGNYHYTVKALAKRYDKLQDVIEIGNIYGASVNLLDQLPIQTVDKILRSIILHKKDDKFWEDSAIQLALSILGIIKVMNEITPKFPYSYNFKTLIDTASSPKKIKEFKEKTLRNIVYTYMRSDDSHKKVLIYLKKALDYYIMLDNIAKESILTKMIEDNEKTVLQSVIPSLINPISNLNKDFLNTPEVNILEELCKGKIIIFSLSSFEENILNAIVSSVFSQIYFFKMSYSDTPVTIIMDEAQKVLNNFFELPLDVLREYKVEVVLATQSIANLKSKLEDYKVDALLANLVHKVYLNGQDMELPKFMALYNEQIQKLIPLEVDKKEKFEAEREFQQKYSKLKDMPFVYNGENIIYSPFYEMKLMIKNKDLKQIGKQDFILNSITKKQLLNMYPDFLELEPKIEKIEEDIEINKILNKLSEIL